MANILKKSSFQHTSMHHMQVQYTHMHSMGNLHTGMCKGGVESPFLIYEFKIRLVKGDKL